MDLRRGGPTVRIRRRFEVRGGNIARGRSGPQIHDEGRSGPSDPDKGRSKREGFRWEEGVDGADPLRGDPKEIKGLGSQDEPEGGPGGQGRVRGGLDHREGLTLTYSAGSELTRDLVNLPEGRFHQAQISPNKPNFEFSSKPNGFNLF